MLRATLCFLRVHERPADDVETISSASDGGAIDNVALDDEYEKLPCSMFYGNEVPMSALNDEMSESFVLFPNCGMRTVELITKWGGQTHQCC